MTTPRRRFALRCFITLILCLMCLSLLNVGRVTIGSAVNGGRSSLHATGNERRARIGDPSINFGIPAVSGTQDFLPAVAGTLDGQLWFIGNGLTADVVTGHVNSDGSNVTQEGVQAADHQSQTAAFDLAAGFYFTVTGHLSIESRSITNPAVIVDTVQIGNEAGPGTFDDDIINALAVDPFTHTI